MATVNQRIAALEDSLDSGEESVISTPTNKAEDTHSHNFLANSEEVELPPELEVVWLPLFGAVRGSCNTSAVSAWNISSDSVEANIGMTAEEFYQEAPCK